MRIAFYAPMKAPDHPVPSGDREMARLLCAALKRDGHEVALVSRFRSWLAEPDAVRQADRSIEARHEAERIASEWAGPGQGPPDLWFTYHNHYKAPDLLGPALARAFALPYWLAEASHSPRRASAWGTWHAAAEAAIRAADVHLCLTGRDRAGIASLAAANARLVDLPPFVDLADWPQRGPAAAREGPPRIVTVAMMRAGDKADSYRFLAAALARVTDLAWNLTVIGDGPMSHDVLAAFATVPPERITWAGILPREAVAAELADGDLYAWPGFGEAFGLSYLEAQAMGLPVVALDIAGVGNVVRDGVTGVLVASPEPGAFADALRHLLRDGAERRRLGHAAESWVRRERTLDAAAAIVARTMRTLDILAASPIA